MATANPVTFGTYEMIHWALLLSCRHYIIQLEPPGVPVGINAGNTSACPHGHGFVKIDHVVELRAMNTRVK